MQCGDLLGGRFDLGAVVREGGMGFVFRAQDRQTGKVCAVKTLIAATPPYVERFEREAAMLASLRHPAVVSYIAHGLSESGEPYLVMEWLDGEELAERLTRGPLSETDARTLAVRVAGALGAAHALGIVHRDVKPSNVVLVGGDVARATLIDFGVARGGELWQRTRTGLVVGTPGYMAPEQARASRDVNARADVYALGCVLFECLTGKPPFNGEHPVAVLAKVLLDEPPRLRSLAPSAPADLDELIARMLSKDPSGRPSDGDAVARLLGEAPTQLAPARESVMPESITDDERVVVHVILAAHFADRTDPLERTIVEPESVLDADDFERRFGLHVDVMADGSTLATLRAGALGPKGGATRAANVARELARATGASVALASGFERLRDGMPLGEVVDRAVELSRHAARLAIEGVLVDELTAGLLADAVSIEERDGARVLGEEMTHDHARPLVGRDRELAVLEGLYAEVAEEGASRVALVIAPPGGGKTRLLSSALERVRDAEAKPAHVCSVRCDETTSQSPLALAAEIVRSLCAIGSGETPFERRARIAAQLETTRLAGDRKRLALDFLAEIVGATVSPSLAVLAARADAMTMSDQIQRAFIELLGASAAAPFVLAIDDLQWCDRASFRLLEAALRELQDSALLFVGLARPDVDEAYPAAFSERALTRLPLSALGKRAAESLVRDVAGDVSGELVAEIVARGEGNAFMLEQLARGVREGRALSALGGTTAVVAARFEALTTEARRVLRAASIVGQRFSPAAVAALLGCEPSAPWLGSAWDELERAEVLVERDGDMAFRHALLRDAAYAMLTTEDKARGHKIAARFCEAHADTDARVVAGHAELGGDLEHAARAYVDAAQSALEATDLAGVNDRVEAAIRCGARGALLGRAERLRGEASFWLGSLRDAAEQTRRALDLLDATSPDFFVAAGYVVAACSRLGEADRALEETRRILTSTASPTTTAARTSALLVASGFLPLQGQVDLAKAILRDVKPTVEMLASTNPILPARYFRSHAICAMATSDVDGFLEGAREAAVRFAEIGDKRNELAQRGNVVYALLEVGDHASAANAGREVIAEAERLGLRNVVALAKQNTGYALVRAGSDEEGRRMLEEAAAEFAAQGHARMLGGTHIYLASAYFSAGRTEEALGEIETALANLASTPPLRAYALALLARIDLERGDLSRACAVADESLALLDSLGGIDSGETDVYLAAAETKLASGDAAGAHAVLRKGRDRLIARAARLDEAHRAMFLTNVRSNAALLDLAAKHLEG